MKSAVSSRFASSLVPRPVVVTFVVCLVAAIPARAQEARPVLRTGALEANAPAPPPAPARFAGVHRVAPKRGGHVEETKGALVSDPLRGELRFDVNDATAFVVSWQAVTAIHYERTVERPMWGWPLTITRHYLVIHHTDFSGPARIETMRLPGRDAVLVLDTLERDLGVPIDRTPARRSFLGVPIRAAIGDRVTVTNLAGGTPRAPSHGYLLPRCGSRNPQAHDESSTRQASGASGSRGRGATTRWGGSGKASSSARSSEASSAASAIALVPSFGKECKGILVSVRF